MKYMLLMQFSAAQHDEVPPIDSWSPDELKAHIAFMGETNATLEKNGEFVDAQGLAMPDTARIVRAGGQGAPVITEGPFPETKEFLAGYWIVDCASEERAVELAAQVSAAPGPGGRPLNMPIEVRQVMSAPPQEL
ncbi:MULTISPECIES: YciI family protein [Streptomyces]|uniref:YciI family protein n=1 Tax=Streptomyces TaxID=1883 RepID=UPI0021092337|nr:YciI family protein [Streptomyces longispororuber]MCQ4207061.1 YciI family protein [Streptomyces longispororuber]